MTTVNVCLPKALHGFVEDRTKAGGDVDVGDYVRALIREDQRRLRDLERKRIDGLNSGTPIEVNKEYWEKKKAEFKARVAKKVARS